MKNISNLLFTACICAITFSSYAQADFSMKADKSEEEGYVWTKDPLVKANLDKW